MALPKSNYTMVPNAIMDELMADLKGSELKVLLAICRQTRGWHRETDRISATQLSEMVGCTRKTALSAANSLAEKGHILVDKHGNINRYEMNLKDNSKPEPPDTDGVKSTLGGVKSTPSDGVKITPTKETITKETNTKDNNTPTKKSVNKKVSSQGEIELHPLQRVIDNHCDELQRFDKPLTYEEAQKLLNDFPPELVKEKLAGLENKKGAHKQYNSVYLTLRNWCRMAMQDGWKPADTKAKDDKIKQNVNEQMQKLTFGE